MLLASAKWGEKKDIFTEIIDSQHYKEY